MLLGVFALEAMVGALVLVPGVLFDFQGVMDLTGVLLSDFYIYWHPCYDRSGYPTCDSILGYSKIKERSPTVTWSPDFSTLLYVTLSPLTLVP